MRQTRPPALCHRGHLNTPSSSPKALSALLASCAKTHSRLTIWFLALEVGTAAKGTHKGLGFSRARQSGAASVDLYAGLHRTTCQPSPLLSLHQTRLRLLVLTTPGCAPSPATLQPKRLVPHPAANSSPQRPDSTHYSPSCPAATLFACSCELRQHEK